MEKRDGSYVTDLRGLSRLVIDATKSVTNIVERMHHTITRAPGPLGRAPEGGTRGITGLVYRSIRQVTGVVGATLDLALDPLDSLLDEMPNSPERVHALGVLNGLFGDHLETTKNPLATSMRLCVDGRALPLEAAALRARLPEARGKVLLLVHGLCMNDLLWRRAGHDHGSALAEELGYTPVYLRYNSGRHISQNGRQLAEELERLLDAWPVPVEELTLLCHSMGGLVGRSAVHYAERQSRAWRSRLRHVVFLGTPHHGAPLERGGSLLHLVASVSPYTAPIARVGKIRSAGITDLRHGNLVDADWLGENRFVLRGDTRSHFPLPEGVSCHTIAGDLLARPEMDPGDALGDGLVPVPSAFGVHRDPERCLHFGEGDRCLVPEAGHLDLLASAAAYAAARDWLLSRDASCTWPPSSPSAP